MKRTPMKRGKGFRMRDYQKAPEAEIGNPISELPSIPRELPKPLVRGVYGPAHLTAAPKPVEHRNEDLLRLARGKKCLLTAVEQCLTFDGSTTVACHRNEGKGMARKADDEYSVWGCMHCHQWYDQGSAPRAEKRRAFDAAHERQMAEWARIAFDMSEPPRNRRAAEWAMMMLSGE